MLTCILVQVSCRSAPEALLDDLNNRRIESDSSPDSTALDEDSRATLTVLDLLAEIAADRDRETDPLVEQARALDERLGSPRSLALHGAAILVDARDDFVWNQIGALDEGGERLDRAIDSAPEDRLVRFLRAVATFPLPSIAGRRDQCFEDLEGLVADLGDSDALWTPQRQAFSCCMFATLLEQRDELDLATDAFRRARDLAPDSPYGRLASERLKTLRG